MELESDITAAAMTTLTSIHKTTCKLTEPKSASLACAIASAEFVVEHNGTEEDYIEMCRQAWRLAKHS